MAELLPQFEAARIAERAGERDRAHPVPRCGGSPSLRLFWLAQRRTAPCDRAARPLAPQPGERLARTELRGLPHRSRSCASTCPAPGGCVPAPTLGVGCTADTELEQLARELEQAHFATKATTAGARAARAKRASEGVSLAGQRFVLFGAGAELSPVYTLLEAGAEVLWLDRERPRHRPLARAASRGRAAVRGHGPGGVDLLAQPARVRATILEFAAGAPVHFGLYAFASGKRSAPAGQPDHERDRAQPAPRSWCARSRTCCRPPRSASWRPKTRAVADERRSAAPTLRRALLRTGSLQAGHLSGAPAAAVVRGGPAAGRELPGRRVHRQATRRRGTGQLRQHARRAAPRLARVREHGAHHQHALAGQPAHERPPSSAHPATTC